MEEVLKLEWQKKGKLMVVKIDGNFYLGNIYEIDEMWNGLLGEEPEVIAFDCSKLKFVDSSAIGTLVKFLNYTEKHNIRLIFFDLNEAIKKIFDTAKLSNIFEIMSKVEFDTSVLDKF